MVSFYMGINKKKKINIKHIYIIILSIIVSTLLESYIVLVENSYLINEFSQHDFTALFSYKEFFIFLILFLIIFYILFDKDKKIKLINFLYTYRIPLSLSIFIIAIIFQIHGSSINELNLFHVNHKTLLGVSRSIRSDEYAVNTLFAFSQYMNDFSYFSDIVRGSLTDMFIIYGQPVLDIGTIFRPFLLGYLFLNQGQGLSFFWIGRLIGLFLVSFEFSMLLTNKNKTLSLSYTFLITFSPLVQWWFAINGLVEQLIFGQLSILLINWYMKYEDYIKRVVIGFFLMICIGGFLLVFYPSWQIPFAYIFIILAIWIFLKNWHNFNYSKKDLLIIIFYISIFTLIMIHILSNSLETIKLILNTSYPGSEVFNGGGILNSFINYIPSIFFPITQDNLTNNVCEYSMFADLFPLPIIISFIVIFYQKTKDKLLFGLLILYFILAIFYLVQLPDFIISLTLRDHIKTQRLMPIISFLGIIILIRSMSSLKKLNKKLILIPLILSIITVYLSTYEFNNYYINWMFLSAILFYFIIFSSALFASSKRNQKIFLICIITFSFLTGGLVNPVDSGTDVIYESDFMNHVEKIVENDPNGLWITQGMFVNTLIPAGAKTINSINTYPDFGKWHQIDSNKEYEDLYNRYAYYNIDLQNKNKTSFELLFLDNIEIHLNVNDLEKLNVTYIATPHNLNNLSNENVHFEKIYKSHGFMIYKVNYMKSLP